MTENDDGQMVVNCISTHLTSFAVLVDVSGSLSVSSLRTCCCIIGTSHINTTLIFAKKFKVSQHYSIVVISFSSPVTTCMSFRTLYSVANLSWCCSGYESSVQNIHHMTPMCYFIIINAE